MTAATGQSNKMLVSRYKAISSPNDNGKDSAPDAGVIRTSGNETGKATVVHQDEFWQMYVYSPCPTKVVFGKEGSDADFLDVM
jgi:hypothetical protein